MRRWRVYDVANDQNLLNAFTLDEAQKFAEREYRAGRLNAYQIVFYPEYSGVGQIVEEVR